MQGESGKVESYDGFDESLSFIKDYVALHGPFDGLWAFSQVAPALLTTLVSVTRLLCRLPQKSASCSIL